MAVVKRKKLKSVSFSIVGINYGLATVGKFLPELLQTSYPKIKIWSTFFKGCGCGQSPQYFRLRKFFIAKQLAVW
ncbi:hypothetical protein, partial [Ruminococcus sp.]|uniref:hypothetical protein n=1 Tax=Ruminococcus sp. TaxID=41978 RepID=UPI00386BC77C